MQTGDSPPLLTNLHEIITGVDSLIELEESHPVLGQRLAKFVGDVQVICEEAYRRLSLILDEVRRLPAAPSRTEREAVAKKLSAAYDSHWFSDVSRICSRLGALSSDYEHELSAQEKRALAKRGKSRALGRLLSHLIADESGFKDDMRDTVSALQAALSGTGDGGSIDEARAYAVKVQQSIDKGLSQIQQMTVRIAGSGRPGAAGVLTFDQKAAVDSEMRRSGHILMLNMVFVIALVILGAALLQVVSWYVFPMVTGFALAAVVVLNAFHLKNNDKLTEVGFLRLIELSLLKFFAPLTGRARAPASRRPRHPN